MYVSNIFTHEPKSLYLTKLKICTKDLLRILGHLRLTTPKKPKSYNTYRTGRSALKADAKTQHQNI
jgi:hypothetical protein